MNCPVEIQIVPEWRQVQPDGVPCNHCGDHCLLRQHTYFLRLVSARDRGQPVAAVDLCGSCYDAYLPELERIQRQMTQTPAMGAVRKPHRRAQGKRRRALPPSQNSQSE